MTPTEVQRRIDADPKFALSTQLIDAIVCGRVDAVLDLVRLHGADFYHPGATFLPPGAIESTPAWIVVSADKLDYLPLMLGQNLNSVPVLQAPMGQGFRGISILEAFANRTVLSAPERSAPGVGNIHEAVGEIVGQMEVERFGYALDRIRAAMAPDSAEFAYEAWSVAAKLLDLDHPETALDTPSAAVDKALCCLKAGARPRNVDKASAWRDLFNRPMQKGSKKDGANEFLGYMHNKGGIEFILPLFDRAFEDGFSADSVCCGWPILHMAAIHNCPDLLELALGAGADRERKFKYEGADDCASVTALRLAQLRGFTRIETMLQADSARTTINQVVQRAMEAHHDA